MAPSLSLVLTVHNAQATLASRVVELLELVAELTTDFEVLIVDDGSTDSSEEVAHEVAREFPQITVLRHNAAETPLPAAKAAMQRARGDVVLLQDIHEPTRASDLKWLWRKRDERNPEFTRPEPPDRPIRSGLVERVRSLASGLRPHTSLGLQMIRREAAPQWPAESNTAAEPGATVLRTDPADEKKAPNFAAPVRNFALGE